MRDAYSHAGWSRHKKAVTGKMWQVTSNEGTKKPDFCRASVIISLTV